MSVRVLGRPKTLKSIPMMDLIVALVESGDFGLSHDEAKRHHSNASKVLNALCREDADWRRAIALPTNGKGGYRVRRLSEVPAERDPEPPTDEVPTK